MLPIVVDPDRPTSGCSSSSSADPDVELRVDLAEQGILLPDGTTLDFDIDPFGKMMLLAGTDEIGYVPAKERRDRRLGGGPPAAGRHPPRDRRRRLTLTGGIRAPPDTRRVD